MDKLRNYVSYDHNRSSSRGKNNDNIKENQFESRQDAKLKKLLKKYDLGNETKEN